MGRRAHHSGIATLFSALLILTGTGWTSAHADALPTTGQDSGTAQAAGAGGDDGEPVDAAGEPADSAGGADGEPADAAGEPADSAGGADGEPADAAGEPVERPGPEDVDRVMAFAQDAFIYGDYRAVREQLGPLLFPEPMPLAQAVLVESWTLYGVSAFFMGDREAADGAFLALLRVDPRARLDALLYPAPVISRFERVREEHAEELRALVGEEPREEVVYIESRVREQPLLVSMMPFGYGFFAMERDVLGVTYLLTEAALGTTSAVLFVINEASRDRRGFFPEPERAERRQRAQVATGWTFIGVVALNALHGALLHPRGGLVEYRTLTAPPESPSNEREDRRNRSEGRERSRR